MLTALHMIEEAILNIISIMSEETRKERRSEPNGNRKRLLLSREESLNVSAERLMSAMTELEEEYEKKHEPAIGGTD